MVSGCGRKSAAVTSLDNICFYPCVSITARVERYPGSQEPKSTTKSHCTTILTHEICRGGKQKQGWLPLLGWETAANRTGCRAHTEFLGKGVVFSRVEIGGIWCTEIGLISL